MALRTCGSEYRGVEPFGHSIRAISSTSDLTFRPGSNLQSMLQEPQLKAEGLCYLAYVTPIWCGFELILFRTEDGNSGVQYLQFEACNSTE
jgi:hypothetical protein